MHLSSRSARRTCRSSCGSSARSECRPTSAPAGSQRAVPRPVRSSGSPCPPHRAPARGRDASGWANRSARRAHKGITCDADFDYIHRVRTFPGGRDLGAARDRERNLVRGRSGGSHTRILSCAPCGPCFWSCNASTSTGRALPLPVGIGESSDFKALPRAVEDNEALGTTHTL